MGEQASGGAPPQAEDARNDDPWAPTLRFFEALNELRAQDPNPKLYRLKERPEGRAD